MFSSSDLNTLMDQIAQLGKGNFNSAKNMSKSCPGNVGKNNKTNNNGIPGLNPAKLLIIAGLLCGALEVKSILVDRDQIVNILLEGSLRRKTKLDKMLDEIGEMPFDDVLKAVLGRV
ncbi:MAG: hypothetical protein A4E53_04357 [Pelotomaculum sp. PtaB.Bin104]|nr:MAG: hypothetical protein A4E53_04357 [Pelotomaculum sp. PtaB.Bin104]